MKVSFKLNKEQWLVAKKIMEETLKISIEEEVKEELDSYAVFCGNLLGYQGHSFSFNTDQDLQLLNNGVVQYTGQRHPLVQDGGLDVLARIAGFTEKFPGYHHQLHLRAGWCANRVSAVKQLEVLDYKTSDPELEWWETASDKAHRLVDKGKVTVEILTPIVEKFMRTHYLSQVEWVYISVLDGVKPAPLGTAVYRQACAAGTQEIQLLAAKYQQAKNFWY